MTKQDVDDYISWTSNEQLIIDYIKKQSKRGYEQFTLDNVLDHLYPNKALSVSERNGIAGRLRQIAWKIGDNRPYRLTRLSSLGRGITAQYQLSGDWSLA